MSGFLESLDKDDRHGVICGAWKIERQYEGDYVMRCDRPEGHEEDHADSVLLTNWHGPTPNEIRKLAGPEVLLVAQLTYQKRKEEV